MSEKQNKRFLVCHLTSKDAQAIFHTDIRRDGPHGISHRREGILLMNGFVVFAILNYVCAKQKNGFREVLLFFFVCFCFDEHLCFSLYQPQSECNIPFVLKNLYMRPRMS